MITEILLKAGASILQSNWNPLDRFKKKRRLRSDFKRLVLRIKYCGVEHFINVELGAVREFFLSNLLLDNPSVAAFYKRWIEPRAVVIGRQVSSGWTLAEIDAMVADLEKIVL